MLKHSTRRQPTANKNSTMATRQIAALVILIPVLVTGCTTTQDRKITVSTAKPTEDVVALHQQAVTLMQQEKWREAVQSLEIITSRQDELSGPWLNLGIAYTKTGDGESAEKAFKKSIDMNAGNIEAYNQLGILYRRTGRIEEAGFIYESALIAAPDNTNIHWNLGILHDKYLPDARKALFHYQRYQQLTGSDDAQLQAWINNLANNNPATGFTAKVSP